ncbi:hypothetical protein SKAU_G00122810 [Synaphobranchus kaupii]|uniref:Uncharacterized protein n=1 Tax=Synaphobranchus kaupii TaxID=118154 RepID=A0A9Q1FPI3_SYNKA|nr:hypothetical protein SKAU_G00122810 [Synaphobranchus kaupii]
MGLGWFEQTSVFCPEDTDPSGLRSTRRGNEITGQSDEDVPTSFPALSLIDRFPCGIKGFLKVQRIQLFHTARLGSALIQTSTAVPTAVPRLHREPCWPFIPPPRSFRDTQSVQRARDSVWVSVRDSVRSRRPVGADTQRRILR